MKGEAEYHESVVTGLTVLNDTDHIKFTRTGNVCVIYIYGNTIDTQFNVKDGLTEMDYPEESGFHPLKLTTADNQSIIPEGYKPFWLSKETDMNKYKSLSVKLIPKLICPFTAVTSENWDEAVVNACIDSENDKKRFVDSPMEKILMK